MGQGTRSGWAGRAARRRKSRHRVSTQSATCLVGGAVEPLEQRLLLTALDDYVAAFDPTYSYDVIDTTVVPGFTAYTIDMTSQTWRSPGEVDRTEWQHFLYIVVPDFVVDDTALLIIDGGTNGGSASLPDELVQFAGVSGAVTAQLRTVPNQPLQFSDETFTRSEDAIIAYTFDKFLDEYPSASADEWPLLLPMTKSAVRAMDTVQDVVAGVSDFVVTGGSKRGWTTYLSAVVDPRVSAIMPAVIDLLNFGEQLPHHKQAYEGVTEFIVEGYSQALQDYVAFDLPDRFDSPGGQALLEIVDPYEYRDRLTHTKFLLHSTGDEFFVPDSSQFYFDDLLGDNYLRYVPNTGHGLNQNAVESAAVFFRALVNDLELPQYSWETDGNTITVNTPNAPSSVKLWQAENTESRDYRWGNGQGVPWSSSVLSPTGPGTYSATVPMPDVGTRAFMIELQWPSGSITPYTFTSEVVILAAPEPNEVPQAGDDTAQTGIGVPAFISILSNDSDSDGEIDPTTVAITAQPLWGQVFVDSGTGNAVYVPNPGFSGSDNFRYTVKDDYGSVSNTAIVEIDVLPPNQPPVVADDFAATPIGVPVVIDLLANDHDPDGSIDPSSVHLLGGSSNGTTSINPTTGELTYTPQPAFAGGELLKYRVRDTAGALSDVATVRIRVGEAAALSGSVYTDLNNNGLRDTGESGIPDVEITLVSKNSGWPLTYSMSTDDEGNFSFVESLADGFVFPAGTYDVVETHPTPYLDGRDTRVSFGLPVDSPLNDRFADVIVAPGQTAGMFQFGERGLRAEFVALESSERLFAASFVDGRLHVPGAQPAQFNLSAGEVYLAFDGGWDGKALFTVQPLTGQGVPSAAVLNANLSVVAQSTPVSGRAELMSTANSGQPQFVRLRGSGIVHIDGIIARDAPGQIDRAGAFDPATERFLLGEAFGINIQTAPLDWPGARPVAGDFDGDGGSDLGLYDPANARFLLQVAPAAPWVSFNFGLPGWLPVVGDWNGDGIDTVGVYNPDTATFFLGNTNGAGVADVAPFNYGMPGWKPIAGDWDGDGYDSIGVYNPDTATFFLRNSNDSGVADLPAFNYGIVNWMPLAGDWNGNGIDTVGVYNPATATFFFRNTNTVGVADLPPVNRGAPGWLPLAGYWSSTVEAGAAQDGLVGALSGATLLSVSPSTAALENPTSQPAVATTASALANLAHSTLDGDAAVADSPEFDGALASAIAAVADELGDGDVAEETLASLAPFWWRPS